MKDHSGRTIDYLRVSITDRCNLRCRYCMPHGIEWVPMEEILTLEEITEVCRQASALGIRKIKITGGEPLVRKGCTDLVGMLTSLPGIEQVTLTTNGILLKEYAADLKRQGLHAVNVSLDTLNPDTYTKITGFSELSRVLEGIRTMDHACYGLIFICVPVSVLFHTLRGNAEDGLSVQFIEIRTLPHKSKFFF